MTHAVVQSDIDFAQRLLEAGCENDAMIAALGSRGLEPKAAAQLLDDLRLGRHITPQAPAAPSSIRRAAGHSKGNRHRRSTLRPDTILIPGARLPNHHYHAPSLKRSAKRFFRWTAAVLATIGISASFGYVSYTAWETAKENAEEHYNRNPHWEQRLNNWHKGIPDRGWDDLNQLPPKP
jgi:hypothetical protein